MFEVRTQDSPAELSNVRNDEARSELCPTYKLGRFWVDDHSRAGRSETRTTTGKKSDLLVELGDKVIGGDRFTAKRTRLRQRLQRIFLAAAVTPTISGTPSDSVSIGHVHFVVGGAARGMDVHVSGLVEVVI